MNLLRKCFLLSAILVLVSAQNTFAEAVSLKEEINKLKAFVDSGEEYIKKHGPEKAYAEFSNPKGKFIKGDLYLFAYDFDGNCLAHGFMPDRIGKNFYNEKDKYGTPTAKLASEVAKAGSGFFSLYWQVPSTNEVKLKTLYIKRVSDNSYIGGGIYEAVDVPKDQILVKLEEVKAFVNTGVEYFKKHGSQMAYKEFSNPNGQFVRGNLYLFVLNSEGYVLTAGGLEAQKLIGKNAYELRDEFGTPFIQLFTQVAKEGGGTVSYYWPEPDSKKIKLKVSYIAPLGDDTYLGAGFYGD